VTASSIIANLRRYWWVVCNDTHGAQIAEFAVALPLLMVLTIGIFDFGTAFNMKQKLTNAAREAARLGSSETTADLTTAAPASVLAVRDLVSNYLQNAKINDCGVGTSAATPVGGTSPWAWSFSATCPNGGTLTLTVDRGNIFTSSVGGVSVKVISTNVTISYPYSWQFNRVIGILVSGASYPGTTNIVVNSTMENQT
jgi:Flp pilus assembly protein TadG